MRLLHVLIRLRILRHQLRLSPTLLISRVSSSQPGIFGTHSVRPSRHFWAIRLSSDHSSLGTAYNVNRWDAINHCLTPGAPPKPLISNDFIEDPGLQASGSQVLGPWTSKCLAIYVLSGDIRWYQNARPRDSDDPCLSRSQSCENDSV